MSNQRIFPLLTACSVAACSPGPGSAIPETQTEKQMLGLLEKFDRWDDNGDGELSAREIDAGIARLKASGRAVAYTGADVVKYYDQNGNGTVSLREAQSGYHRTTQSGASPLPQ